MQENPHSTFNTNNINGAAPENTVTFTFTDESQNNPPIASETKKKNSGLIVSLVICIILAIGGIAFGVYGMVTANNKATEISVLRTQIDNLKAQNPDASENDNTAPTEASSNSYSLFANNLTKSLPRVIPGSYYHYTGNESIKTSVGARIDQNAHLTITDHLDNHVITEADSVINVYYVHTGNGDVPYFYILYSDGNVSRISLLEASDRTIEPLNDYHDIVSVVESADLYVWLIDINGNAYKAS